MKDTAKRSAYRVQANREELAELISRALPEDDGTVEPQPGLHFRKHSSRGKRVRLLSSGVLCCSPRQ